MAPAPKLASLCFTEPNCLLMLDKCFPEHMCQSAPNSICLSLSPNNPMCPDPLTKNTITPLTGIFSHFAIRARFLAGLVSGLVNLDEHFHVGDGAARQLGFPRPHFDDGNDESVCDLWLLNHFFPSLVLCFLQANSPREREREKKIANDPLCRCPKEHERK